MQLFSLMLVFFLPMLISWYLYHYHQQFHFKTTNHGTLITPVIDGRGWIKDNKKWHILYVENSLCDEPCRRSEQNMLQVQKALGKDRDRVEVVFIPHHQGKQLTRQTIYLVDPIGNLFMSYPGSTDPMNILKDMKHILEVSQIG